VCAGARYREDEARIKLYEETCGELRRVGREGGLNRIETIGVLGEKAGGPVVNRVPRRYSWKGNDRQHLASERSELVGGGLVSCSGQRRNRLNVQEA
jgi:hypothetical protein